MDKAEKTKVIEAHQYLMDMNEDNQRAFKELMERKELQEEYQRVQVIAQKWGYWQRRVKTGGEECKN